VEQTLIELKLELLELDRETTVLAAQRKNKVPGPTARELLLTPGRVRVFQIDSLHFAPNKCESEPKGSLTRSSNNFAAYYDRIGAVWQV
jgi:hypothetical protein